MSDSPQDTPSLARWYCPGCEPAADPSREILEPRWCSQHELRREGSEDDRVVAVGHLSGSAEAGGDDNRLFCRVIHRRSKMAGHLAAWLLCWIVSANAVRTIDGDTFTAVAAIWPGLQGTLTVRVLGVDTPEMKGATRPAAEKARDFTKDWLNKGEIQLAIGCGTQALDSFGRYLAIVTRDRAVLADDLIAAGMGVKR